jgi:hypothetical protein
MLYSLRQNNRTITEIKIKNIIKIIILYITFGNKFSIYLGNFFLNFDTIVARGCTMIQIGICFLTGVSQGKIFALRDYDEDLFFIREQLPPGFRAS